MIILGATGHQDIPGNTIRYVTQVMATIVAPVSGLTGVCALAAGADQLFAEIVLQHGGLLKAIIPCDLYENAFTSRGDRRRYRLLLNMANEIITLDYDEPSEAAFFAAGKSVVDMSDQLIAVWDGRPAQGVGGTADVVAYARKHGKNVDVIWPAGARR